MNLIGQYLTVLTSSDPGKVGRKGMVVLETANTLLVDSVGRLIRVEKPGSAFLLQGQEVVMTGSDIAGRLQDRWGRRKA